MLGHELERLLYRILSGKTILKINSTRLDVVSPSLDLLYEANEIYCENYKKYGILSRDELREELCDYGIIDRKLLQSLKDFPKAIEEMQKEIFLNFGKEQEKPLRKSINFLRNKRDSILLNLSKYETYCREGLANYAKSIFLIENTVYHNNILYDFKKYNQITVLSEIQKHTISNEQIRFIAKSTSWANLWYAIKGGNIFKEGICISLEQQLLLMWTKMYDSIRESTECPTDDIINDDDALDGWLAIERDSKEKEKEKNRKKTKLKTNSKIENSQEVFYLAQTKEDVDRINSLNSLESSRIKNSRIQQIYNKGEIAYQNFADVQMEIQMQAARMGALGAKTN